MVNLISDIKDIISILKNLNFQPKSPESLTTATLITLGDLIKRISIKGVVTDDDLKWIRQYCDKIRHFWITMPPWLRKALSRLSESANFNTINLNNINREENRIIEIENAYIELTKVFIGVYEKQAAA